LKKVEATTDKIASAVKLQDVQKPLDSLKETISQSPVTEAIRKLDIVDSVAAPLSQNIQNALAPSPSYAPPPEHYKEGINLLPSGALLRKYQNNFLEVHNTNVNLAQKAEAVDRKLPSVVKMCMVQNEAWKKLDTELSKLPEVSASISNIRAQIDTILVKIDEVEVILGNYAENYVASENAKSREKVQLETNRYKVQKQRELSYHEEELNVHKVRHERDQAAKEKARLAEEERARRRKEDEETRARKKRDEEALKERKLKEIQDLREKKQKEEKEVQEKKQREEKDIQEKRQKEVDDKQKVEKEAQHQEKLRSALDAAFQQQVADFKSYGPLQVDQPQSETTIEQFAISESTDSLQNFLGGEEDRGKDKPPTLDQPAAPIEESENSLKFSENLEVGEKDIVDSVVDVTSGQISLNTGEDNTADV